MTFEEMQQIIQQMLGVQRELQDSQLKLAERQQIFMVELEGLKQQTQENTQAITEVRHSIQGLVEIAAETNVKFERLIGYSINRERDSLDIQEEILNLKRRLSRLEEQMG